MRPTPCLIPAFGGPHHFEVGQGLVGFGAQAGGAHQAWIWGWPEESDRLAAEQGLPPDPATLLAVLADRTEAIRAIRLFEGPCFGALWSKDRLYLFRDAPGFGGIWWRHTGNTLSFAFDPRVFQVPIDIKHIQHNLHTGERRTPYRGLSRLEPGEILVFEGQLPRCVALAGLGPPPSGRTGHRPLWDKSIQFALSLAHLRAKSTGLPALSPAPLATESLRTWAPRLFEPTLHPAAWGSLGTTIAGHPGRIDLPFPELFGRGLPLVGTANAWQQAHHHLAEGLLSPLRALSQGHVYPEGPHPAILAALARIPTRHLRGWRSDLATRMGLPAQPLPPALPEPLLVDLRTQLQERGFSLLPGQEILDWALKAAWLLGQPKVG